MNSTRLKYYIIPSIFGFGISLLMLILYGMAFLGGLFNIEKLAIPYIIGLFVYELYSLPAAFVLYPFGVNIFINHSGAMVSEVNWIGILMNIVLWYIFGLFINLVFQIRYPKVNSSY